MSPRLLLAALACALALPTAALAADPFGSQADLGTGSMVVRPQTAVGPEGSAVVAWATDSDVLMVERASRAAAWSTPVSLGPSGGSATRPRVAMDGAGRAVVAWVDGTILWAASRGGGTWASPQMLPGRVAGAMDVAFDGTGRATLVYANDAGDVVAVVRDPATTTFGAPTTIDTGTAAMDIDVAADDTAVAVAYSRSTRLAVATRVGDAAWSGVQDFAGGTIVSPSVALTAGHVPVVAFEDAGVVKVGSTATGSLAMDSRTDPGRFPQLAADASGHVVAIWRNDSGDLRSRARDAGGDERWSAPYTVASGVNTNQPVALAVSGAGEATAVWADMFSVHAASAPWNATLGSGATVANGNNASVAANAAGDLVVAFSRNDDAGTAHAWAVGTAPAQSTGTAGAEPTTQQPSGQQQTDQQQTTNQQTRPDNVKQVFGVNFTMVPLAERRDKMPLVRGLYSNPGVEVVRQTIPFADVDLKLVKGGCPNGASPTTVVSQSPASGTIISSSQNAPARVSLGLCLPSANFVRECDERPIEKALKKIDDYDLGSTVIAALAKCKVDWDVKFVSSKQAQEPEIGKVDVKPTAAKRDPMDSVLECPTDPKLQNLRIVWSVGARLANAAGFHAADPQLGWTLPGPTGRTNRITSFVHMSVIDRGKQFVRARAYVDTDGVGAPQMRPMDLDGRGERSFSITPDHPGLIRVCVVYEPQSGPPQFQTAAIRVVDPPKEGETWPMTNGRVLKVSHGAMVPVSAGRAAGPTAHAAGLFDGVVGFFKALFGGTSKTINAQSGAAAQQVKSNAAAGYEIGQIAWGGTLAGQPALPRVDLGTTLAVGPDGKVGYSRNGQLIQGSGAGTAVGAGPNGVVAPGGGNVVAPGGGNVVAAGGGNVVAAGGGNVVAAGGANALPKDVAALISDNGLGLIGQAGGNVMFAPGAQVVAAGGGNVVAAGGLN